MRKIMAYSVLISNAVFLIMTPGLSAGSDIRISGLNAPNDPIAIESIKTGDIPVKGVAPTSLLVPILYRIYQRGAGPTKGVRCPMYPSCSEYSRISVVKSGLVLGILKTSDRLHRCGHDLSFYPRLWKQGQGFSHEDLPR